MAHLSNRVAVVMSGAALLMSIGFTGGPVIARAIVPNADKVDGLHAVKAKATTDQRKGKLVATNPRTGAFRANVVPTDATFPDRLPSGVTLRGMWGIDDTSTGSGDYGGPIDFGIGLPSAPTYEVVPSTPTANCPGSFEQPEAAPGYVCLYINFSAGLGLVLAETFPWGITWHANTNTAAGGVVFLRVSYVVTAE